MKLEKRLPIPNTLALRAYADIGCRAHSNADVVQAQAYAHRHRLPFVPIGEGSNIVPHASVHSFVCVLKTRGIDVLEEGAGQVRVRVAAGENWHQFVLYCLQRCWFGLENLALIPGTVGAAPVQNIGAYGVEVAEFIEAVEVLGERGEVMRLSAADCCFRYRDSVFKQAPGQTILSVTFKLATRDTPVVEYPELQARLQGHGEVSARQVAQAVMAIRQRKLPSPAEHPNAGSFFKNPVVSSTLAAALAARIADLQQYPVSGSRGKLVKLSAAQLIDRAGWKDKAARQVECWQTQPLVLVNKGGASDVEVMAFAAAIAEDIDARYGVQLELEPSELS